MRGGAAGSNVRFCFRFAFAFIIVENFTGFKATDRNEQFGKGVLTTYILLCMWAKSIRSDTRIECAVLMDSNEVSSLHVI